MTVNTEELWRLHGAATRKPLILGGNAYADKADIDHHNRLIAAVKDRLFDAAPSLLDAADRLARIEAVLGSFTAIEDVAAAIDADLARQAALQTGCNYERADECGLSSADMNIVVHEAATAALAVLRELIGGV